MLDEQRKPETHVPTSPAQAMRDVRERYEVKQIYPDGYAVWQVRDLLEGIENFPEMFRGPRAECQAWIDDRAAEAANAARWQPIETAPRDGRFVFVSDSGTAIMACWEGTVWLDWASYPFHPTHWMPLPQPPAGDAT